MIKSDNINELATALIKAHAELPGAKLDSTNPFLKNKYASLSSYLEAATPILTKHGLAILQLPSVDLGPNGASPTLTTILLHSSGQYLGSTFDLILTKNDMQSLGSAITYARRYGLAAILGMGVEDDDANQAVKAEPKHELKNFAPGAPKAGQGASQVIPGAAKSPGANPRPQSKNTAPRKDEHDAPPPYPWPGEQDLR